GWSQTMIRPVYSATAEKNWLRNTWTGSAWSIASSGSNPTGAQSGTGVLWIDDYNFMGSSTPLASARIDSPAMNLSTSTSPFLRFWYFNNQGTGITLNLRVMVSRNGGTSWENLSPILNGFTGTNLSWNQISVSIPEYYRTSQTKIAFEITNRWGTNNPFIDNVVVQEFTPTTISSIQSGDWNAAGTWNGGIIPTADNHVIIESGHTVTVTNAVSATGILARCQNLWVNGTLNHGTGTANHLHAFGHIYVNGVFNAYNGTSGRTVFVGGNFVINVGGSADFSVGSTVQASAAPTAITTGASQLMVMGANDAEFSANGTLVNSRINNFALLKETNFNLNSPATIP
ncbi:MAG: choice-of-anchor J domain-containing protein, partial [Candidatus Cloacimonadaceae bacterium]|nr:choice-of-anchor J domain-containing protein [Candidatus Cloacimonadaceae bacterium]